jgi:hypothetical protein
MTAGSRKAPETHAATPKAATVTSTATDHLAIAPPSASLAHPCSHNDSTAGDRAPNASSTPWSSLGRRLLSRESAVLKTDAKITVTCANEADRLSLTAHLASRQSRRKPFRNPAGRLPLPRSVKVPH